MNEYLSTYYKKDKKMVKSTILHLRTFNKKKILPINKITREFCVDFLDYLRSKLRGNTLSAISRNSECASINVLKRS